MGLNILIIKTSSLGDVLHGLSVVSDIKRNFPESQIDWLVEEAYEKTVALNRDIRRVIPIAVRRWRKKILNRKTWLEISNTITQIRLIQYELVIDLQGLIKSALFARSARGLKVGFDHSSIREPIACWLYDKKIFVEKNKHMIHRCRELAAKALGYGMQDFTVQYGLKQNEIKRRSNLAVILTGTAQKKKLWPENNWKTVIRFLESKGFECQLPWGNIEERQRCERLRISTDAGLVPAQGIEELAKLMANATIVIGVDTGLLHLAATQDTPLVGIYGASDPLKTGPESNAEVRVTGSSSEFPKPSEVIDSINELIRQR